jgi:(p)ppGpp synthase/HD superfamily hydrolase
MNENDNPQERSTMLTQRLAQALALAIEAHDAQYPKGADTPYPAHPMAVAAIALEHSADED